MHFHIRQVSYVWYSDSPITKLMASLARSNMLWL